MYSKRSWDKLEGISELIHLKESGRLPWQKCFDQIQRIIIGGEEYENEHEE